MNRRTPFERILIANRGEVAMRIARTASRLGHETVAIVSRADSGARHASAADQAVLLDERGTSSAYLDVEAIIEAARKTRCDAIHPGYGFLAENARFASACCDAGLVFIGPTSAAIAAMGDKATAKRLMENAGIRCIPGYLGESQDPSRLLAEAERAGWPVMIKAAAGGGGRGIRVVHEARGFFAALETAKSEARTAFGDEGVILEKLIPDARHIEIQIVGDRHGRIIHLGERDCSVQRRYQKVIEEAPAPGLSVVQREGLATSAVAAARAIDYEGVGTVEYLLDPCGTFYFMEMNTRLQVEHPVTEATTGLDLVELQLRIAAGEPLAISQEDIRHRGHAIEVRLCSEDPLREFMPQSGRICLWQAPTDVRVEHALESGSVITPNYDSLLAKLITVGADREEARRRMLAGLRKLVALGVRTNQHFLASCLRHPIFVAGAATTAFIGEQAETLLRRDEKLKATAFALGAGLLYLSLGDPRLDLRAASPLVYRATTPLRIWFDGVTVDASVTRSRAGELVVVWGEISRRVAILEGSGTRWRLACDGIAETVHACRCGDHLWFHHRDHSYQLRDVTLTSAAQPGPNDGNGRIVASMTGRVVAVHAKVGDLLAADQAILTIEAMKMEHTHKTPIAGRLVALAVELGMHVEAASLVAQVEVP